MGSRASRVEVSDAELAQRLLEGAQTALRALLAGDDSQIRAAEAALQDAEATLQAGLRDLGIQVEEASSSLPVDVHDLLRNSKNRGQGFWGVGCAQLAMALSVGLNAAAASAEAHAREGSVAPTLSPTTRRRLTAVADNLKALCPDH